MKTKREHDTLIVIGVLAMLGLCAVALALGYTLTANYGVAWYTSAAVVYSLVVAATGFRLWHVAGASKEKQGGPSWNPPDPQQF